MSEKESKKMKDLLTQKEGAPRLPHAGEVVEGQIIKIGKSSLILDLGALGTGIIYGGEIKENKEMIKELKVGQTVSALVIDSENEDGYVELSLKEANLEKAWLILKEKKQTNQPIKVKVKEANRGGLVIAFSGIIGFLPVSQLSSENYPRVEGGDKSKILNHLNKFIGKEMEVKIIGLDQRDDKLIVSEKALEEKKIKEDLKNYKKGDIIEGTVTALADFGAFIKFNDSLEGLAHISELDWQIIDHPNQILKEKEKIKAQIIDIQDGQISLSLKALKDDPWQKVQDKYKNGQIVKGRVTKLSPFGAFIQIDKNIHGLAHVSEFTKQKQEMEKVIKLGQSYDFEIISLAPESHKMSLVLKNYDQKI